MTRVGIDIGGTFTDFVFLDGDGQITIEKQPSTPDDLAQAIDKGLESADPDKPVEFVAHGTTVGINAVLERKHPPCGLLTTTGFRDIYEIGRHNRVEMYDLGYRKPAPLAPRHLRLEARERIDARGTVLTALERSDVEQAARHFQEANVASIAIVFLHSYVNPAHEQQAAEIIASIYPKAMLSLSHSIAREWREYERTSTTAINAYVLPLVAGYLERVEAVLDRDGRRPTFYISKSSGGLMSVRAARGRPVQTIMSGPAGGATAAAYIGQQLEYPNVIGFDMGGTSADVSLIHDGTLQTRHKAELERHPLLVPMIDINSVGAGGGSIAWITPGGGLGVGPQSAGAVPGPACYGRGGSEPTVTDANVVLGRIDPEHFTGGGITLDPEAAEAAITERIAEPLALSLTDAAQGIVTVVNTIMAHAIRAVTIERGLDPRDFVLLAFGGAGPLHACAVAEELAIAEVVVPPVPGTFSALGMLASDVRYDFSRIHVAALDDLDETSLESAVAEMRAEALETLGTDGSADAEFRVSLDVRYQGQEHTLTIPIGERLDRPALASDFDELHERTYAHSSPGEPKEIVSIRLTALGAIPRPELQQLTETNGAGPSDAVRERRDVFFPETGFVECAFVQRERLSAGARVQGPAVVEEQGATTLLPPGFELEVGARGTLHIRGGSR